MGADGNDPAVGTLADEEFSPVQLQGFQQIPKTVRSLGFALAKLFK